MPRPESVDKKLFLLTALLFLVFLTVMLNLTPKKVPVQEVLGEEDTNTREIAFWEAFLAQNPTYIEGWVELSGLLDEEGLVDYAEGAQNSAKAINPNHKSIEK